MTITPLANQFGSATITVTVSDGNLTASSQFTVHGIAPNKPLFLAVPEFISGDRIQFRILGGYAGRTNVLEASGDLVHWLPIGTNVFPATKCAVCPFIVFLDSIGEMPSRFYRAINR